MLMCKKKRKKRKRKKKIPLSAVHSQVTLIDKMHFFMHFLFILPLISISTFNFDHDPMYRPYRGCSERSETRTVNSSFWLSVWTHSYLWLNTQNHAQNRAWRQLSVEFFHSLALEHERCDTITKKHFISLIYCSFRDTAACSLQLLCSSLSRCLSSSPWLRWRPGANFW